MAILSMVAFFSSRRASLAGSLLALTPCLLLLFLAGPTLAGMSKNFLGNNNFNPQDQMQRTFYPKEQFSRYRRNYLDDESSPFPGYPGFSGTAAFRGGKGGRKGGPRVGTGSRGLPSFPGFGEGPGAFLEEATTERIAPDDDSLATFKFNGLTDFNSLLGVPGGPRPPGASQVSTSGSSFGFPGGSSNTFGNRDSPGFFAPGNTFDTRPPAGRPGVPGSARPSGTVEGGTSVFTGSGQGGVLRLPSTGPSSTRFGGSQNSFFGGVGGGAPPNRSPNSNSFMNPFLSPFPGSNTGFNNQGGSPFGSPGTGPFGPPDTGNRLPPTGTGTFKFPTDVKFSNLLSQGLGDPLDGGPYSIPDEFRALFADLSTTVKPPLRVTSAEDTDRVFPGNNERELENEDEDYEEGHEDVLRERIPLKSNYRRPLEPNRVCNTEPSPPRNGRIDCSSYSGCRAVCETRYQFPTGERRFFLRCDDGEWVVAGGSRGEHMPDCEPICRPPCQNNGICLAPNKCQCPDNWEGLTCETPKPPPRQECSMKPPTPANSKIFCGNNECNARCHEGYQFAEGMTRLSFMCEDGDWVIRHELFAGTNPDCEPICDPACLNGGSCIAPDLCQCLEDYRGDYCQYPISNCDPKKMGFNGGHNCSGKDMVFGCQLWCPPPVQFEFPAAELYSCDYATSIWSPSPIPMCDYEALREIEESNNPPSIEHEGLVGEHRPTAPPITDAPPPAVRKFPGTCFTWSNSHYKTFDGKVYSFESTCPYTLLRDVTHGTFSVNLRSTPNCEGVSCNRTIQMFLEDEEYVLGLSENGEPSLEYKDTSLAIPGHMNGVVSERVAHFVVLKVSGLGLTLKWDMKNLVVADVSEVLWNRTGGLCGQRDGNQDNDWSYPDGSTEYSLSAFVQGWQAKLIGERCLDQPHVRHPCSRPSPTDPAVTFCSRLQTDPKFADCRQVVDVEPFVRACRWDYCSCRSQNREDCACSSLEAFFRECASVGVTISGGWRSQDLCPMTCSNGKVYNPCMSAIQARCGQPAETVQPDFCVEGCDCPPGLVLHGDVCVRSEDCPCTYHDKEYNAGDNIPNDCNSCTCLGGKWVCTEIKCGSRCAVVGDPHYTTFDGRRYDFMGKCSYYLVQAAGVSIEAENTPCAGSISEDMNFPASITGQFPSCTKSVTVRVEGTVIRLKQKGEVTVNGVELKDLPAWVNGVYIKRASSLFIMVELSNGLDVWWDGQTRVYVDAPADFRGETAGLCGTFTDNQRDDFLTPQGDIEQNAIAFANKWKTSERCENQPQAEETRPCETHVQNKAVAEKFCAKIKSSLFAKCHLEVDPEPYYRDCLYDMCSCETKLDGCLCPILAAYSKECARKGITIDWRAEVRECGVHCTGGQKYQVCGNSCARTCLDLATNVDCQRKCVEGCNCLEGFSLDSSGICVPITECPCVYQAKEYKPGYEMMQIQPDGTYRVCECYNTDWNCWEPRGNESVARPPQVQCESNEVYVDCLPEEENTCQTMHLRPVPSELCRPGCVCAQGYVRNVDTGICTPHNSCPCHHGGRSYEEGDVLNDQCNTCKCEGGQWLCTDTPCPGICTAWGDSHYKTFDGRLYDFHGTCDYLLAKGKASRTDTFEVTIQNVPCGTSGVTCAKSITLRVGSGDTQEVVEFSRNKPPPTKNMTRTIIREAGLFVFAEVSDMGLVLQWDRGTRAYLRLDTQWQGKVRGLCGNFNGDDQDDFQTPAGGSSEVSVKIFGDSWRLQNYCPDSILIKDTCSLHPQRKVWATERCAILKTDSFSHCHSEVPVEPYLERCQFDACGCDMGGDCECLCTAIAAYVHECSIHSVYIKWRTPEICPMQCDESCEHYEPCIPTCPMETCDTLLDPAAPLCTQDACVEGCARDVCPPSQVHKSATDLDCVPKADCEKKCMEVDGEVFMEGDIISQDDCHTCTCSRKKKICRGTPCTTTTTSTTPGPIPSPTSTISSTYIPGRVTTPLVTTPGPEEEEFCRNGWTEWLSDDKPIIFRKNSDVEPVPERIWKSKSSQGFCSQSQMVDIRCRAIGTHRPHTDQPGVTCLLNEGLFCEGRDDAMAEDACWNYEVAFLCDCSLSTVQPPIPTTPATPATPPPAVMPSVPPVTEELEEPYTCEDEGWSEWYNLHSPDSNGEFESLSEIRKTYSLCPDHYISEVECRPVRGGEVEPIFTCNKRGAMCRNNGDIQYCQDYEVRVFCQCECQDGLGMENYVIPNEQITASSQKTPDDKAHAARLNADWAWTAEGDSKPEGESLLSEWLQIDLGEVKEVTGVVTQGHPHYNQYVKNFVVQFSETGLTWEDVMEPEDAYAKQFQGNTDSSTPVTNLFPEPVFARYVRIVPTDFHTAISLRVELKGCDIKEVTTTPPTVTPPLEGVCIDGWTEWMNTHTPGPGDWDDRDDLDTLTEKYTFCAPHMIVDSECQAVGHVSLPDQYSIVCNVNNGLQCNDDLQGPDHCYDYEIRFFCDCSLSTTPSLVVTEEITTTPVTAPPIPPYQETCSYSSPQIKEHEEDCRKFYECAPALTGLKYVEKECGPGTFFNPRHSVCDFEYNVIRIKPECKQRVTPPHVVATTTPEPCIGDFWTEWFNVSHPAIDGGDFETFENIRRAGLDICDNEYITDVQCHFMKVQGSRSLSKGHRKGHSKGRSKGRSKGGRKGYKGGGHLDRLTYGRADFSQSKDRFVQCSITSGLSCPSSQCEDYAIRVRCSCEATRTTPAVPVTTQPPERPFTTPAVPTTTPEVVSECPQGQVYVPNAIPCMRVCAYYRYFLRQNGICQHDGEYAPACLEPRKRQVCPPHQYLRDKDTCVAIQDCNCRLRNGQAAPPGRPIPVDHCEVCQCVNNLLMCDKSACITTTESVYTVTSEPQFICKHWSSWVSLSVPSEGNEQELIADLEETYPKKCREYGRIQCRVQGSHESIAEAGQVATCDLQRGLVCQSSENPEGCKDYEVRVFCICNDEDWDSSFLTMSTTVPSTTTHYPPPPLNVTTERPSHDKCPETMRHEQCAMPCNRICMYYQSILKEEGWCLSEDNCAPGCVEPNRDMTCPPGMFGINQEHCVQVADCNCRLSNGQALPPDVEYQVSKCELCRCKNNALLCSRIPDCEEPSTKSTTLEVITLTTPSTTFEPESQIVLKTVCNSWSPFYKKERESEGLILSLEMLRTREEFLCENPINATCREVATKIPASDLNQILTCDAVEGLKCLDLENAQDCYNYEISFYCFCEEVSTPPPRVSSVGPTTTLAPCDSWSPWINTAKPWQADGDTEYRSLEQLQEEYNFCLQGQLADIECVEAASGANTGADVGLSCDVRFGFRCTNSAQERGSCLDYKIRYYCTCETTTVITTVLPDFTTPPPKCYPDKYINLLKNVDDSAFSSTPARSTMYGPASARLYNPDSSLSTSGWSPLRNNWDQFLEVNLGSVTPVYGLVVAGNPLTRERITAFNVQYSRDGIIWTDIPTDPTDSSSPPKVFQGPISPVEEKQQMFDQPIEMQYLRVKPTNWYRAIALRLEVIGCELPMVPITSTTTELPKCDEPMGVENGLLSDLQIVVSSVLDDRHDYYGKQNIRLNTQPDSYLSAGVWVAKPSQDQFVRFDFTEPSLLSGVVTQGHPGSPEWVESFTVGYSPDGESWNTIKEPDGTDKVFIANFDSNTPVENKFDRLLNTRFLELRPKQWNSNIALRVEVLGCFHPYPEVTTTPAPVFTTTQPPPPYCVTCPGLPEEYYMTCIPCTYQDEYFDGQNCVPLSQCPCYKEGSRYEVGQVFESKECKECQCVLGGETFCVPKECPPCDNDEKSVMTPSCSCVCKPCPLGTRLCPSSNFCLNETSWCDGIEDCPDDELTCTTPMPEIPSPCPTPYCPEHWQLKVHPSKGFCPKVKCEPPPTPSFCPSPKCPPGYTVVVKLSEAGNNCPEYDCNPPLLIEPTTCPPPTCPEGYEVQGSDYVDYLAEEFPLETQQSDAVCFQYICKPPLEQPKENCSEPVCPENYEIFFSDVSVLADPCPPYECVPVTPSTPLPCPAVECPNNLTIMYIHSEDRSTCPRYTCVQVTPIPSITTPSTVPPKCPQDQLEIVICSLNEELYRVNPVEEECPKYACKPLGSPPPIATTAMPHKELVPVCTVERRTVSSFGNTDIDMEVCNHILAQDKINKDWVVAVHSNCSESDQCTQYLSITLEKHVLIIQPDLHISWDDHIYTIAQAQRIGTSSKTFSVSRVGNSVYFESKKFDFSVEWNVEMNINITLGDERVHQVDGLCGLHSDGLSKEKVKPDGSLAHSTEELSDAWSMEGDDCKPKCSREMTSKAFELCNKIMLEPFTECHKMVNPAPFIKNCFETMCDCLAGKGDEEECRCQALTHYVSKCLEKNPDASISDWRITTKCYKECGPGEIYQDCFRSKCEKQCETLDDESHCPEEGSCIPGCFCAPGLVRKGERCVPPERCRDCVCEGYGDPHYTTFDRLNYTFNGECSFVAARDKNPRGQHKFQVITNNKQCTPEPVTVCTDAVTILYDSHEVLIVAKSLATGGVQVTVDKEMVDVFPYRSPWLSLEQPDLTQVMAAIPDIQLEVTYFMDNFGFAIRLPSALYFNKTEGLCGNCNHDKEDDFLARDTGLVDTVNDFGRSWLLESEPATCGILKKEELFCTLLPPEVDPCLAIMDEDLFGKCHPLEDPVAYVSSCQLDSCGSREPQVAACHALEAYARRCADLDICLNWRSEELCPKTCHGGQEYQACGPGCVRTCDNYEELEKNPDACPISSVDGCTCPEGTVLDKGSCVNESYCKTCDDEGHRIGDEWQTDPCTTCHCTDKGSSCSTKTCPHQLLCEEGYILEAIPGTGDDCCGPLKQCKIVVPENCTEPTKPKDGCGYGQKLKKIEAPGLCPQYACVCLDPEDCPQPEKLKEEDLDEGEEMVLDTTGCCPKYITECTGLCPTQTCPPFHNLVEEPLKEDECCPKKKCELPPDACIYTHESPVPSKAIKFPGTTEKKLYKVNDTWQDGNCLKCVCKEDGEGKPHHQCAQTTCPRETEHPDYGDYQLEVVEVPDTCCPNIVRTACIDDYEVIEVGDTLHDPLNGCRSVDCIRTPAGKVEKVEKIYSCDETCPLGWRYEPSPLYPQQCCGTCVQVSCVTDGEVKAVGETWHSEDHCTIYTCAKNTNDQIQMQTVEVQCIQPTEAELALYVYQTSEVPDQCCPAYTRTACLLENNPISAGEEVQVPDDRCTTISCSEGADGNVTRREKETTCDTDCDLGYIYKPAAAESFECCGHCVKTHCVDDGHEFALGERWESEGDACYEYSCELRNDLPTILAVKKECPYFDPECPENEIRLDESGCCRLCNVTRQPKRDCQPKAIPLMDTVGLFQLSTWRVGTCRNPNPVPDFRMCSGHCDSSTDFKGQGRQAKYVSTCYCCRPSRFEKIRIQLNCDSGVTFSPVYDNIAECECLECGNSNNPSDYPLDQPIVDDDTEFFSLTDPQVDQ
ncbi:uncharacterized protein LOC135104399 [Scylla paramamosain]|uniref:uncharacterized protein LOC135104399 n=1 Tax=Scylla paramamosain TaxID=85552 RepID=UPI0030836224